MRRVVFETPGLIDPRAFTLMGVSAKPGTGNPIGMFGTGLKYAIAVLVREGISVTVWIGQRPHVFYVTKGVFRGKEFGQIRMRRRGLTGSWTYETLPYTTEYGKNWKLWQVLRELESNTRDENGKSYAVEKDLVSGVDGVTRIVVEGDAFAEQYDRLADIFLPNGLREGAPGTHAQYIPGESNHLYWRGLRVADLRKPSLYAWNVLSHVDLTEDRTLASRWWYDWCVMSHIADSKDEDLVRRVLLADENTYESELDFAQLGRKPGEVFLRLAKIHGRARVYGYATTYMEPGERATIPWQKQIITSLTTSDPTAIGRVVMDHQAKLQELLERSLGETEAEPQAQEVDPLPATAGEEPGMPF